MADDKPIIIIKKKGGHGGHHGGAWKVAYADFVTAMMAFFMVMWLVNSAETTTKQSIASYFRRPGIFHEGSGSPLMIGEAGILQGAPPPMGSEREKKKADTGGGISYKKKSGTDETTQGDKIITYRGEEGAKQPIPEISDNSGLKTEDPGEKLSRANNQNTINEIAEQMKQKIAESPELSELLGVVDVQIEADGLKIEIMDTDKISMFNPGSASISEDAKMAFYKVTEMLKKMKGEIEIFGHTDSNPYGAMRGGYGNWELSADRANAARRMLEANGYEPKQIKSVVGRSDKEPRYKDNPGAAGNRRISIRMKFDFNKTIDVAKDPKALDKIPEYQKEYEDKKREILEMKLKKKEEAKALADAEEEYKAKKSKGVIMVPEDYKDKEHELTHSKDKIFGNSPVITKPDVIFGDH